jgi:very-short-patch-repair endonuclease
VWNRSAGVTVQAHVLDDLLRSHDGVITLAQAEGIGLTRQAVARRARLGRWQRRGPGVYFVDDRPFTDAARLRAAVWSYGDAACLSGLAAAFWLELTRFAPEVVEVTVPRDSHGRCHDGSRVRRRDLRSADIVERRGVRVTSLPLTAIEAATRRGGGAKLVDEALQRHTELPRLWAAQLRNTDRYGSPAARRLLQAADTGTKSHAERKFAGLLKHAGITGWQANRRVMGYEVDFYFRKANLVVEVDGFAFHTDPESFERDRRKQNALIVSNHQVLRFTWIDLTEYPDRTIELVKRAISAR